MYRHIKWLIFPIAIVLFVSSLAITFAQSTDIVPSDEILVLQGSTLYRFQADAIATTTGLAQPTTTTKLSDNTIPASCEADLRAITQAIVSEQNSR
jgi:hypothetical protein